jgi:hypothetical protein
MPESYPLTVTVTATLSLHPGEGFSSGEILRSFTVEVDVPEEVADRAVGSSLWDAKEVLETYVAERVVVNQNAQLITMADRDGSPLCDPIQRPSEGFQRLSSEQMDARAEDGRPLVPAFVADDSDAVTLQITSVERA